MNNRKNNPFVFDVKKPECVDVDYLTYVRDMQEAELEKDKEGAIAPSEEKVVDVDEVVGEVVPESGVPSAQVPTYEVPKYGEPLQNTRVDMATSLGSVFGGGKATNDGNIQKLATIDKDLGLKTDIKDVVAMTCLDMIEVEARREKLVFF